MSKTVFDVSPMARAFEDASRTQVAAVDEILGNPALPSSVRSKWSAVRGLPGEIVDTLQGAVGAGGNPIGRISAALRDGNLSEQGRAAQVAGVTSALSAKVTDLSARLLAGMDAIEQALRVAAFPTRPTGPDAATLELLARQRAEMACARLFTPEGLRHRLTDLLGEALSGGDEMLAWLLCSPWTEDLIRAKVDGAGGVADAAVTTWRECLPGIVEVRSGQAAGAAALALRDVTGPYGFLPLRLLAGRLPNMVREIERQGRLEASGLNYG